MASISSHAAERFALVIGVDEYQHLPEHSQLNVAVKDAQLMADTLQSLSPPFSVKLLKNATQRDTMKALTSFVTEADAAECALVYFAGHGFEYHGSNFLLASDVNVSRVSPDVERMKRRLGLTAVPLQAIVDELDGTGAQVKMVILDACRDNPLKAETGNGTRSVLGNTRGLASVTAPSGTLISFSADAGQQANDGLFTKVLAKYLKQPGLPLPHVFALTREEVKRQATELRKKNLGVFHEPAEYTKLNVAGMRFSFLPGPEKEQMSTVLAELERLKRNMAKGEATPETAPLASDLANTKIGTVAAKATFHRVEGGELKVSGLATPPEYYLLYYTGYY